MRDGDLDSDIVYHEYGHGLTWRMIGDMSGAAGSAVGEGMSDALATYFNGDDRIAEYSYNNAIGIRSAPYTNYTRTYGLVVGITGPHLDGEIYAATLWRLRQQWLARGWSHQTLLRYIVDGMNYTAQKPAYEDMRDGILASMASLSTEVDPDEAACTVWDAFAHFGIGVGADGSELCVIGLCFFRATESFTKPAACAAPPPTNTAPAVVIGSPADGSSVTAGNSVTFAGSANDTQDGVLTAGLVWSLEPAGADRRWRHVFSQRSHRGHARRDRERHRQRQSHGLGDRHHRRQSEYGAHGDHHRAGERCRRQARHRNHVQLEPPPTCRTGTLPRL